MKGEVKGALAFAAAVASWFWLIVFCNLQPGVYVGTCDGEPISFEVDASGNIGVACNSSIHAIRVTSGGSVTCKERAR